jgi:mannan polymerase complexes MNN9 subunit
MRNAIEHIWHFFHLVDSLTYPRHLLHLAILVSDTSDGTYTRALELADERQYGRKYRGNGRYGRISVYHKDFAADQQKADDLDGSSNVYAGANIGSERHTYEAQVGRRKLLGKSRTWLLTSALAPEIDWVLWADVDLVDYEATLVERLMAYAQGSLPAGTTEGADVVVPNCVWKTYNEMGWGSSLSGSFVQRHHSLTNFFLPEVPTTATTGSRRPNR